MNRYNQTQKIMEHLILKNRSSFSKNSKGRLMVVFTGTATNQQENIKLLENLRDKGYSFDFILSINGEKLLNIDDMRRRLQPRKVIKESSLALEGSLIEEIEGVLVPFLTQNTAMKLSLGIQDQLIPKFLWEALWMGIPIWMNLKGLSEYKGMTSCSSYMIDKIKAATVELQRMGVKSLDVFEDFKATNNIPLPHSGLESKKTNLIRKVITERDILAFEASGGKLSVPIDAIITPLAKDAAKARRIKIIKG